jgi:hypothetical protein
MLSVVVVQRHGRGWKPGVCFRRLAGVLRGLYPEAGQARSVTTTHALFARKVQRKVSHGVAQLAAAGSSWIAPEIAAIPALSVFDQARASIPADVLALGSSCVSLTPQLKRE